ncbi:hypothetical protein AHAS_Ahas03G0191800 [Arachis hypogaea]
MTRSLPDLNLPVFDPEIERTISRIRQVRRRLVLSEDESETSFKEETSSLSTDSVDLRAGDMAAPRRVTIQEAGAPDYTLQPYKAHHPAVAVVFEIKTALLNLMPKFHGLPAQEPIKHLRDFQIACSIVKRDGTDETSIPLKAFPFSLEGKAREWYYTQPGAAVSNWDTLRIEFLEKFFPAEGMKSQDKTTLEGASNGHKQSRSRTVADVSSSKETAALTQSLCEMTNLLKQMQLSQQQAQPSPPQQGQQLVPQRVCGICADYSHYTNECLQIQQKDNTVAATHNFYDRPNQGYNQGGSYSHGWQDNPNQG